MTPTLLGRWQTRLFLMGTVGLLMTLLFCGGAFGNPAGGVYFAILVYLILFGMGWDCLYISIQGFRWDQDWPALFQWLAALWEALFFILLRIVFGVELPYTDLNGAEFPLGWFICHYLLVWAAVFIASQSLMRLLFPHWRFHGGEWF
ncbi:MAG: hypothetical protein AAGB01_08905 [Cyanobacteria bacterium P01_F01_bin.42]